MSLIKLIKSKVGFIFSILITQLLAMQNAYAFFAEPGNDDMSKQFIGQIFGSLVGTGGSDALGNSIATFNGAVLIVGGILVAYTIFAGTLGTAHDGEMLGKKFSSVWVPIRTALGTALILPILPGGYCVMQSIVMWLILQGVSLGNMIWSSYMSNPPSLSIQIDDGIKKQIVTFVEDAYLANVCVQAYKKAHTTTPGEFVGLETWDFSVKRKGDMWEFGEHGGNMNIPRLCGIATPPTKPETSPTPATSDTKLASISSVRNLFKSPNVSNIYTTHVTQIGNVITATETMATSAVKGDPVDLSQIDTLANTYMQALLASGNAATTGLTNSASNTGWFMAGTWATQIIFLQSKVNSAVNSLGKVDVYVVKKNDSWWDSSSKYFVNGYKALSPRREGLDRMEESKDKDGSETSKAGASIANVIIQAITGIDFTQVKNDSRHPILILHAIGEKILTAVMWSMIGAVGAGLASSVKIMGFGVDLSATYIAIYGTLGAPLMGLVGVGGTLAYIIPNTPFLLWIGIITGWTIMVIEAVLAAPLWAVMHLHPSGDDMTGRGGSGYMLVLGLVVRPALTIFGLIAAIVTSDIFGRLINVIFFDLFTANTMEGGLGFFSLLFGAGLYAGIMMLIFKNTFSLMHVIPDQMLRWIGGGSEQLGQYANSISEGSIQKGAAAAGTFGGMALKSGSEAAGKTLGGIRDMKDKRLNEAAGREAGYAEADRLQGAGAGEANEAIDKANGIDGSKGSGLNFSTSGAMNQAAVTSAQQKQEAAEKANQLGGGSSPFAMQYRQNLAQNLGSGMSFQQASQQAFSTAQSSQAQSQSQSAQAQQASFAQQQSVAQVQQEQQQQQATTSSTVDSLGGENSFAGAEYNQELGSQMASGATFDSAHESAYSKAFDSKFGSGTYSMASQISKQTGGALSVNAITSTFGSKMERMIARGTPEQDAQSKIGSALSNTINRSQAGEGVISALKQESKNLS